jgi:hypothetical protein
MASFIDLMAQKIFLRRGEFVAALSGEQNSEVERRLAIGVQEHWHSFVSEKASNPYPDRPLVGAVDGSRAIRALSTGADWIIAQALLIGPNGLRLPAADTLLLRGEIERPAVDRYASLLMRSLELDLALKFVQSGVGNILLLDGSLYADLPYLLYNLTIGGYEDFPLKVLEQYLELFALCQQRNVLLLGISKSARSATLGRAVLEESRPTTPVISPASGDALELLDADVSELEEAPVSDTRDKASRRENGKPAVSGLPTDGELLYRWTKDAGLTDPILLGSTSFGHVSAKTVANLALRMRQSIHEPELTSPHPAQQRIQERLSPIQERLLNAPAIGTFYVRLAAGDEVLRVDALASAFGRTDLRLLEFDHTFVPYTTALPLVQHLLGEYGGLAVYNAALYVVDQEVRLHAETVDHVYLPVLRHQLSHPIQYDRSTRRFMR